MTLGEHLKKWKYCRECLLCKQRTQTVLGKGDIPCDVLFAGEGPGLSEDAIGLPFVGPAGQLLDDIVAEAFEEYMTSTGKPRPRCAYNNLVACFPREAKTTDDHSPPQEAIEQCSPRLVEFLDLCNPKLIVSVGALADDWLPKWVSMERKSPMRIKINHPAFILRELAAKRSVGMPSNLVRDAVSTISNALEKM